MKTNVTVIYQEYIVLKWYGGTNEDIGRTIEFDIIFV